jgi:hypothetical protein
MSVLFSILGGLGLGKRSVMVNPGRGQNAPDSPSAHAYPCKVPPLLRGVGGILAGSPN